MSNNLHNKALSYGRLSKTNTSQHCHFCDTLLYETYTMQNGDTRICPVCFEKHKDEYNWIVEDWRIMGQEFDMKGVGIKHVPEFKAFSDTWDHEHCEFCWTEFSEKEGYLHEGYCTIDEQRWICPTCFEDFKERFKWEVVED